MRRSLIKVSLAKTMGQRLAFLPIFFESVKLDAYTKPAIAEFLTDKTMGQDCEEMVQRYKVGRRAG